MTLEICTDQIAVGILAKKYGAQRIELCSALDLGGLTPSFGLTKQFIALQDIETHCMIRHRDGGFVYNDIDKNIMLEDIHTFGKLGAHGVVIGALLDDDTLDLSFSKSCVDIAASYDMQCTFHRAFDMCKDPKLALEQLIDIGIKRILTSGQKQKAIDGLTLIAELVNIADKRIEIMAGSGVNKINAISLIQAGVDALHFTAHTHSQSPGLGMGSNKIPNEEKIKSIVHAISDSI